MIDHTCQSLADRFATKQAAGLVDIKFYINRDAGADIEQVYEDAEALLAAVDDPDRVEAFAFNDRRVVS